MSLLNRAAPTLKTLKDGDLLKMVGFPTMHILDDAAGCTRPDVLANTKDYAEDYQILIAGERVLYCGIGEHEVEFDPFSDDPNQTIRFKPIKE